MSTPEITKTEILNKVYTADNHNDLMDAYQLWASDYEKDTVEKFGYVAFLGAAKAMDRFIDDKNQRVLDAGCGTGLVGVAMKERGFCNMDRLIIPRPCWKKRPQKACTMIASRRI